MLEKLTRREVVKTGIIALASLPFLSCVKSPEIKVSFNPEQIGKIKQTYDILLNSVKADKNLDWFHLINKILLLGDYQLEKESLGQRSSLDYLVEKHGREVEHHGKNLPYFTFGPNAYGQNVRSTSQFLSTILGSEISPSHIVHINNNEYMIQDFSEYIKFNIETNKFLKNSVNYNAFQLYTLSLLLKNPDEEWQNFENKKITLDMVSSEMVNYLNDYEGPFMPPLSHAFEEVFYYYGAKKNKEKIYSVLDKLNWETNNLVEIPFYNPLINNLIRSASNESTPVKAKIWSLGHRIETYAHAAKILHTSGGLRQEDTKTLNNLVNVFSETIVKYQADVQKKYGKNIIIETDDDLTPHELARPAYGLRNLSRLGYL